MSPTAGIRSRSLNIHRPCLLALRHDGIQQVRRHRPASISHLVPPPPTHSDGQVLSHHVVGRLLYSLLLIPADVTLELDECRAGVVLGLELGDVGDGGDEATDREADDVAAVVDARMESARRPVRALQNRRSVFEDGIGRGEGAEVEDRAGGCTPNAGDGEDGVSGLGGDGASVGGLSAALGVEDGLIRDDDVGLIGRGGLEERLEVVA